MIVEKMVDVFVSGFQGTKDNLYYSKSPTLVISMGDILTFSAYAFANKSLKPAFKGQNVNLMMIVEKVIVSRRGNYLNFYFHFRVQNNVHMNIQGLNSEFFGMII